MGDVARHHVQFPRLVHEANKDTKEVRRNHWLIPPLIVLGHIALHDEISVVPVLDRFTAQRVNRDFVPHRGDYIRSVENLMFAIDDALKHPKTRAIEIENAQVAIHALELQLPFIKEFVVYE